MQLVDQKISVVMDLLMLMDLMILQGMMMMNTVMKECFVMKKQRFFVHHLHSVYHFDIHQIHVIHVSKMAVRQTVIMDFVGIR